MRILYLADTRFPIERANGIQSMETCHALGRRGHQVTLLVRPDSRQPPRDPFEFYGLPPVAGVIVEHAPVSGPAAARRTGYLTYAVGRALGRARHDLLFTRDLGLAALLLRLPRSLRPPLVYEAHGIAADIAEALPTLLSGAPAASPAKLRRLARRDARVWRDAEGYVTVTDALQRELRRRYGDRPLAAIVPDGTRPPAPLTPPEDGPFTIGYAGHLYPWKGVDLVIEAVAALTETRGLIIGGHEREPDLERVRALARQLDCASRVTFTGLLPPADVARQLRRAHVLALPNPASAISTKFTSPLKLFEYMAAGRPIVASDLPAIREILADEKNALLVQPGNPQAFTAAVRRLLHDPPLGARLAARALQDVRRFTWDARASRLEALFDGVVRA